MTDNKQSDSGKAPRHWQGSANSEEERSFLQSRLSLFAGVFLIIEASFTLFLLAFQHHYADIAIRHGAILFEAAAVLLLATAVLWLVVRRARLTSRLLATLDATLMLLTGVVIATAAFFAWDQEPSRYGVVVTALFIILGRALIVPSTWQRTLMISTVTIAAPVGVSLARAYFPMEGVHTIPAFYVSAALAWGIIAITLATIGSFIIYGLHEKIREARQLGQYTLVKKLGEGGMGVVYMARHAMLRRPTAIKLLPPAKISHETLERFEREVQLTASLTHPNTVAIYDYGRSPDGLFYYAMELLDGIDLQTLIGRHGPQPQGRVVHILRQVCGALGEAHERGLVHRDVKPANIILVRRGSEPDIAKVVDFGLVKDLRGDATLTSTDAVTGTPAFMAPENITAPDQVGPQSDLYSLGAVAYFLLTGMHVFSGKTVMEVCSHHVHTAPEKPSTRMSASLHPQLEALVLACLAKKPEDRPAGARTMRRALDALEPDPQWDPDRAMAFWDDRAAAQVSTLTAATGALVDSTAMAVNATLSMDLRRR